MLLALIAGTAIDAAQTHAQCSGYTPKKYDYYSPVNNEVHKLDCTQDSRGTDKGGEVGKHEGGTEGNNHTTHLTITISFI